MGKIFDSLIKFEFNIVNKFGGDKNIEVGSGHESKAVLVMESLLDPKAIDLSENKQQPIFLQTKKVKKLN